MIFLEHNTPTGCATSFRSSFIWLGSIPHGFSCFKKAEVSLIPCQSKAQALNEAVEVLELKVQLVAQPVGFSVSVDKTARLSQKMAVF
jgi:hypothetical protein